LLTIKEGDKMKKYLVWLLITVLVVSIATVALASFTDTEIQVSFRNIKIIHNGKTIQTNLEPFIYNGHVYLPIRDISQLFSVPVAWDQDNNTVILGTKEKLFYSLAEIPFKEATLTEQPDGTFKNTGSSYNQSLSGIRFATIKGKVFKDSLYFGGIGNEYFLFPLNGDFETFSFIAGATDDSTIIDSQDDYAIIKVYGDSKLLYESPHLSPKTDAIFTTIKVKGVQTLKIEKELHGNSIINIAVANGNLRLKTEK
jgi:outer membrane protein assembly factor BamB